MADRPPAYSIFERGWIIRVQPPSAPGKNRILLMLHGWTGDEKVMAIFGRNAPEDYWLISPRGPVRADPSGYGWLPFDSPHKATFQDFALVTDELDKQVQHWLGYLKIPTDRVDVMGFSQGGAMALSYLIRHPDRIDRTACLAGFLPSDAEDVLLPTRLMNKSIFIAHGTQDQTIPIHLATRTAELLAAAGARVDFCQEDVGHKLGSLCNKNLELFFKNVFPQGGNWS